VIMLVVVALALACAPSAELVDARLTTWLRSWEPDGVSAQHKLRQISCKLMCCARFCLLLRAFAILLGGFVRLYGKTGGMRLNIVDCPQLALALAGQQGRMLLGHGSILVYCTLRLQKDELLNLVRRTMQMLLPLCRSRSCCCRARCSCPSSSSCCSC